MKNSEHTARPSMFMKNGKRHQYLFIDNSHNEQ